MDRRDVAETLARLGTPPEDTLTSWEPSWRDRLRQVASSLLGAQTGEGLFGKGLIEDNTGLVDFTPAAGLLAANQEVMDKSQYGLDAPMSLDNAMSMVPGGKALGEAVRGMKPAVRSVVNQANPILPRAPGPPAASDTLFEPMDLSQVPNVPQFDLPRYEPPRGVSARVADITTDPVVRDKMIESIEAGRKMGGAKWYNADPLRQEFINVMGDRGDELFRRYMGYVGATSPRSDVSTNARNASYYYARDVSGQPLPAIGDKNPEPYGHLAQKLHQGNALTVQRGGWDPLKNPKPPSFVENLVGNQLPGTIDTHAFRLPAIHARDPRFLETGYEGSYVPGSRLDNPAFKPKVKLVLDKKTGEPAYTKKGEPKSSARYNIKAGFDAGEMSMDEAAGKGAYWQAKPNDNEYLAMENYYKGLGGDLGMTTAQTQASAWVGGGELTGLASDESKPFMGFMEEVIMRTAAKLGQSPREVLTKFIRGEQPLLSLLGGGAVVFSALPQSLQQELGQIEGQLEPHGPAGPDGS
jgi:hypothetical protein